MSIAQQPTTDEIVDFNEDTALGLILATVQNTPSPRNREIFEVAPAPPDRLRARSAADAARVARRARVSQAHGPEVRRTRATSSACVDAIIGTEMLVDLMTRSAPKRRHPIRSSGRSSMPTHRGCPISPISPATSRANAS